MNLCHPFVALELFPSRRLFAVALALASAIVSASPARADAAACMELHATGQRELKAGRLKSASERFTTCGSDETCPAAVRTDCIQLFESVERVIPTVIFSVVDEQGSDLSNEVKVFSADQLLVENLDGRATPVDPGRYHFRFALPWGESVMSDVLIREGEKNRAITIRVVDPKHKVVKPATPPVPISQAQPAVSAGPPAAGFWVASGLGIAALSTGVVFEVMGYTAHSDLADCSPRCDPNRKDDYDAIKRNYLIGDIAIGAGLVSLGVAALVYFGSGNVSAGEASSATFLPRISIVPQTGAGASVVLSGDTF